MKKLTRKLFISVLVAVFAFVALGTSTYAWITLSNNAEVNAFEAQIEAGEAGIELSEDYGVKLEADPTTAVEAATWKTSLTLKQTFSKKLNDLTMDFTDNGMTFSDYVAKYDEATGKNSMVKTTEGVVVNEDYIEFSIWMKRTNSTDDDATTLVKVNGAKVAFKTVSNAEPTFTYTYGTDGEGNPLSDTATNLLAINAARLSITGNTGENYAAKTAIYEQTTDIADEDLQNTTGWDAVNGFAHKYAASQDIEIGTVVPTYTAKQSENGDNDSGSIITLKGNTPVEIKVRVWIEGWDNECHAQILTQQFSVAFGFEIVK